MREADIKQQNEQKIQEKIQLFLANIDSCYTDIHNNEVSNIVRKLSEAYRNLKESEIR